MARAYMEEEWSVHLPVEMLKEAIEIYFRETKVTIREWTVGLISGDQGSQVKARTKGVWKARFAEIPKRIFIRYGETPNGFLLRIRLEETLGFGLFDGKSREKYMAAFKDWINGFKELCPPAMAKPQQRPHQVTLTREIVKEVVYLICPFCKQKNEQDRTVCKKCGGTL